MYVLLLVFWSKWKDVFVLGGLPSCIKSEITPGFRDNFYEIPILMNVGRKVFRVNRLSLSQYNKYQIIRLLFCGVSMVYKVILSATYCVSNTNRAGSDKQSYTAVQGRTSNHSYRTFTWLKAKCQEAFGKLVSLW